MNELLMSKNKSLQDIAIDAARIRSYLYIAEQRTIEANQTRHELYAYFGWANTRRDYPDIFSLLDADWEITSVEGTLRYGKSIMIYDDTPRVLTHVSVSIKGEVAMMLGVDRLEHYIAVLLDPAREISHAE